MMAAISPAESNYDETLGTLNYARRAKTIKNEVKRNEDVNEKMLRELKNEIEKLRQQIVSIFKKFNNQFSLENSK